MRRRIIAGEQSVVDWVFITIGRPILGERSARLWGGGGGEASA